jgi:transcriptional regulator with XRE-family HTH domain
MLTVIREMSRRACPLTSFGQNVRRLRDASGLTQERLADKADLDPTYISGIERGVRNPTLLIISRLAKALGVPLSELCRGVSV